ncbi:MAG: DUF4118 domain-containing protein [Bacillota bacterium]
MKNSVKNRGKLTIFLGAVNGVGKTYAISEAGYGKIKQGINVMFVNDMEYVDLDVDSIIKQKPQLVIVDNLSHLNSPGSCHKHRYQDVNEILEQGIDVYTSLNIYNVESLNDIVARITGYRVKETVPDKFIETAEQIKLIDVSYEELIQRVKEGNVSIPTFSKEDLDKFLRPGNINALRELALRYAAQRLDKQIDEYMKDHHIEGPWPASEKILACVSPSPFSSQVIRTARRMATGLKAEWIVAYIETPHRFPNNEADNNQLISNLRLAEELGAEVITIKSDDVAKEVINLAHNKNITQIVVGKPLRNPLKDWWKGSIVDNIILGSRGISIHIIPGQIPQEEKQHKKTFGLKKGEYIKYLATLLFIGLITTINMMLHPFFDLINIALLYLLPVLFSATYWGRGPSIFASLLGVLAFDVLFVPPVFSLTVDDLRYLISFFIFLLVAIMTSTMAIRLKNQAEIARQRETRTAALYALSRKIVAEDTLDKILKTVCKVVAETIDGEVFILMPDNSDEMTVKGSTNSLGISLDEKELTAANWVFTHGNMAGKGTETFTEAKNLYLPLKSEEEIVGILGVKLFLREQSISSEQSELLEAFANLTALAIIRMKLAYEAEQARYLSQSEKLRTALFNSISHELRTPLASIIGAVTSLLDEGEVFTNMDKKSLLSNVNESAQRMNRLVGNLLDMARLESGMMKLKWEWCDLQEIIGVAIRRLQDFLTERNLIIDISNELPLVKVDFALIEQVLVNLLDNAIKYSPAESDIKLSVAKEDDHIKISVLDKGPGILDGERERVFDKFYRLHAPQNITGTGLGLSICKGIIEAHGGEIWIESLEDYGSQFTFTIPLKEQYQDFFPRSKEAGEKDAR